MFEELRRARQAATPNEELSEVSGLELADMLAARLETRSGDLGIEIFDLLDVTDNEDIQNYLPGIGRVWDGLVSGFRVHGSFAVVGSSTYELQLTTSSAIIKLLASVEVRPCTVCAMSPHACRCFGPSEPWLLRMPRLHP